MSKLADAIKKNVYVTHDDDGVVYGIEKAERAIHALFPDKEWLVELLFEVQTGNRSCRNAADEIIKRFSL